MSEDKQEEEYEVLNPQGHELDIGGKKFVVKPLVYKDYVVVMRYVADIMSKIKEAHRPEDMANLLKNDVLLVSSMLEICGDDFAKVIAVVLGTDEEFVKNSLTFENLVDVLVAFFEQNKVSKVVKNFQKLAALTKGF